VVIDTRPAGEFAAGFAPGTLNLPLTNVFVTWAGWLLPYDQDVYLVLGEGAETRLAEMTRALSLIGLDRVAGCFAGSALGHGLEQAQIPQLTPLDLASRRGPSSPVVVDVRNDAEWASGHLASALHIPLGHLSKRLSEIPRDRPVVAQCRTGGRSSIAASLLHRAGFSDVSNLAGGIERWKSEGLPTN